MIQPIEQATLPRGPEWPALALLRGINDKLDRLLARETVRESYTVPEFAAVIDRAEFTVREWCRLGRINARKLNHGRGPHCGWTIPHSEIARYQAEGLLPERRTAG